MNMQTLRKKTSPLKYKNETTRFLGDGVSFKAKLIGILEVSEARGDRMCQEALSDLKMAIRAAGEHKQRITINIAIDGLRLRDEKTGDSLYHHPVHKISFIAQDMSDSRAFGYIFGSPDTGHRFFGIKTDKAASQVVIAMRDLFQVVFALKKKEIELAKQHLDKGRYTSSPLFSDSTVSSSIKSVSHETTSKTLTADSKAGAASSEAKSGGTAVADLVDLELELNSLQQGLNQMERITPSDPFGSKDDPFGDSFTSYMKPILPPPPSGRERASRTSDSSVFSPRTAISIDTAEPTSGRSAKSRSDFSFSQDFSSSREEPSSGDWFTPSGGNSIFEEPSSLVPPEPTKDEKHELAKQEILSQFDVFTELDPLGTGRSKPYIDKKHFFQELKNPPKKVLKDLVSQTQSSDQPQSLPQNLFVAKTLSHGGAPPKTAPPGGDLTDPFGEDPFVTEDPFAEADFSKQDPFENEFNDNKIINKFESRSPGGTMFEKQRNTVQFKQSFQQSENNKSKLMHLHENPSLDMSSESECAPEPPPRPTLTLTQIKPPPLPPKKQANDLSIKPPPRPPHSEDPHYDYMDNYETAPSSLEFVNKTNVVDKSPPLPVPARKARFETDFTNVPERPKKPYEDDYLTPISLPPPQRAAKKNIAQVTVASYLESKPNLVTSNCSMEGLDITLSQLTLSGLNELATKLNIPSNQLSNMTLVQLTSYLSNVIKSKNENANNTSNTTSQQVTINESPVFTADFAANFSNNTDQSYDRYAVFRELMEEEIKQTKIDTEPEEIKQEKEQEQKQELEQELEQEQEPEQDEIVIVPPAADNSNDKYAALREIVESEFKQNNKIDEEEEEEEQEEEEDEEELAEESNENIVNLENKLNTDDMKEKEVPPKYLIEYNAPLDNEKQVSPKSVTTVKSPVPVAITEIIQNNARLTSGSLSDVVSGSSPEVDNTASNSEMGKGKGDEDAAGESWAIFDQGGQGAAVKEKQAVQSEEGVSPLSSDSKEFGNGSPPDWRRGDSGSGGDHWPKRRGGGGGGRGGVGGGGARRDQEGWWDTSAEPEMQYKYQSSANRRSTDSYEDEYYECYERPRRRKAPAYVHGGGGQQATGGHSSSSRDVSPWEEEPRRRDQRPGWPRHPRQHSFEKHRDRRHADSWDEEDDYEYEDEHVGRFHRPERHAREVERDRHSAGSRDHDGERWGDDGWSADRRHRRKRDSDRDRRCCQDCDQIEHEKHLRYGGRYTNVADGPPGMWRERKHDDRYYSRESQESPWDEDEYSNHEADEVHPASHYLTAKRNWKRPSSASEIDRKTGEIKSRHYLATGSSDGENRRYKPGRRSRSRDSQYSEPVHRHKPEAATTARSPHSRGQAPKQYSSIPHFEGEPADTKPDLHTNKKSATSARKKPKESPKSEENVVSTFPRKAKAKPLFENDFSEGTVLSPRTRFNFEKEFETPSEAESPTIVNKPLKGLRQQSMFEKSQLTVDSDFKESYRQRSLKESRLSPRFQSSKQTKSMFEDDFSPSDRPEPLPSEDISISSIKEEIDPDEAVDSFNSAGFENATTNSRTKKKLNKHRLSGNMQDVNIKKSESVNIFARESDPFDDDFFSENAASGGGGAHDEEQSPRTTDLKWTDDFTDFDIEERK